MGAKGLCTCSLHSLCAPVPPLPTRAQLQVSALPQSSSTLDRTLHVVRQVPVNAQATLSPSTGAWVPWRSWPWT